MNSEQGPAQKKSRLDHPPPRDRQNPSTAVLGTSSSAANFRHCCTGDLSQKLQVVLEDRQALRAERQAERQRIRRHEQRVQRHDDAASPERREGESNNYFRARERRFRNRVRPTLKPKRVTGKRAAEHERFTEALISARTPRPDMDLKGFTARTLN